MYAHGAGGLPTATPQKQARANEEEDESDDDEVRAHFGCVYIRFHMHTYTHAWLTRNQILAYTTAE
jgi:hypothetical protein